jgi:hypothetical protein
MKLIFSCKFGTELPVEVWRRQHTSKVCNDNIASFKKYDTSRLTIEEPTRGDENPCPICNQETLGVKVSLVRAVVIVSSTLIVVRITRLKRKTINFI